MKRSGLARSRLLFAFIFLALILGAGMVVVIENGTGSTRGTLLVSRTWSDAVDAPHGMTFYLLDVNVTDAGPSTWHLDPSQFSLTSNGSRSYTPTENYSEVLLLGKSGLLPGHNISGEVAFLLPANQAPSTLGYSGGSSVSVQPAGVPAVSGVASRFDPSVHFQLVGASTQTGAITTDGITAWAAISNVTSYAMAFFGGESGYRNYTFVFFTGQRIYVSLFFYYYRVPGAPNSMTVDSVASDDGYSVSDVLAWGASVLGGSQPVPLPATMTGYGSSLGVTLLATVPPGPQAGVLHFTVQFSANP